MRYGPRNTVQDKANRVLRFPAIGTDLVVTEEFMDESAADPEILINERTAPPPHWMDPYYEVGPYQAAIEEWINSRTNLPANALCIPVLNDLSVVWSAANEMSDKLFTILKVVGHAWHLAPFVGKEFFYYWWIAKDEHGRFVCSAQLIRHMDTWEYERLRGRDPWEY